MKQFLWKIIIFSCCLSTLWLITGCQTQSGSTLKIAATAVPHAEILEQVKPLLKEQDINLDIIIVEDYTTPNRALNDKEVDANFFQHIPFLEMQMQDFGYPLEKLVSVHLEPMALYSKKITTLTPIKEGLTIAIPSDPTNQARALCLLQQQKLITLKQCNTKTSLLDVLSNPHHFQFIEIDSPLLTRALDDVDLAAITTNFALQAGLLSTKDALAIENEQSLFVNIIAIRQEDANRSDLQALKQAVESNQVRDFINNHYHGVIIPAF